MTEYADIDYSTLVCPLSMMSGKPVLCITHECGAWIQKPRKQGGETKACLIISGFNAVGNAMRMFGMKLNEEFYRNRSTANKSTIHGKKEWGENEKDPDHI